MAKYKLIISALAKEDLAKLSNYLSNNKFKELDRLY